MPDATPEARARAFREELERRRSVRDFAPDPVPRTIIEDAIRAAGSAPSGANMQPWHFVAVSDHAVKRRIREAAEREEVAFYQNLAGDEWLADLADLGTDAHKPFLEDAPWLIVVFAQPFGLNPDGTKKKHYYVPTSVGIATGMLITALQHAGLGTLTYTPARMGFLRDILDRPTNERPVLILVTGYPAPAATYPSITRKPLTDIATFIPVPTDDDL